jgi:hypothetical protein
MRTRAARLITGDPPVRGAVDRFVRYGFAAAWFVGLVALVGAGETENDRLFLALLVPVGAVFTAIGVLLSTNYDGSREHLRQREDRKRFYRATGLRFHGPFGLSVFATRVGSTLLVGIGLVWLALGLVGIAGGP